MKKALTTAIILAAAVCLRAQSSEAGVVLSDNFNSDTQTLNWNGDAVFNVVPSPPVSGQASVDLIGTGFYDFYPGHGNYLDLDGSTGYGFSPAGVVTSVASFGAGTYNLTFDLGGNARAAPAETTVITLGSTTIATITLLSGDPYSLYSFNFSSAGGHLTFTENGPSDQQGNILDNVTLATTPLPSTWTMLIAGFVGLGFFAYRGSRKNAAIAAA
jgi:hypothetical protein